jgi:uncharacterized protein with PIN domain/sulfur carrier protein ThiS
MPLAYFRFYAELNDLLATERRAVTFAYPCNGQSTVKDTIESIGVPHTEVDLILVNGEPVDFSYRVQDGDRVSVYPVFESIDIASVARLRPEPLRETRFVLDTHLGTLARYLHMLGFDTLYHRDAADEELARISRDENRILLTRDRGLLKRSAVTHGHLMRETVPRRQLTEVVEHFDLYRSAALFRRCLRCNTVLCLVDKTTVAARLPERTRQLHSEFRTCESCGRVYWSGSHYARMRRMVDEILIQVSKESTD